MIRRPGAIVIDCPGENLDAAAEFWSAALGRAAEAYPDPRDAHYRRLASDPGEPLILLQRVDHAARVHLDLDADDVEAEVARLSALGAREVARVRTWVVMEAPTGHRFCVIPAEAAPPPAD
jgi:predicted enzyme related to lactoylglutathione lyase